MGHFKTHPLQKPSLEFPNHKETLKFIYCLSIENLQSYYANFVLADWSYLLNFWAGLSFLLQAGLEILRLNDQAAYLHQSIL